MTPEIFFVLIGDGIQRILGVVEGSQLNLWREGHKVIKVINPKLFELMPVAGSPGRASVILNPIIPIETPQKEIEIMPTMIHVFGEIVENECKGVAIFNAYTEAVNSWSARQSGLLAPTAQDMARIKTENGPFRKH